MNVEMRQHLFLFGEICVIPHHGERLVSVVIFYHLFQPTTIALARVHKILRAIFIKLGPVFLCLV